MASLPPIAQAPWRLPDRALVAVRDGQRFLSVIGRLDRFSGTWLKLKTQSPDQLKALRMTATIQSAASSTRIEGAQLTDDEVRAVLAGLKLHRFRARDEQEVRGYRDLLEVIYRDHSTLELTESTIKEFHRVLLAHSEKDAHHRGEYKKQPNDVERSGEGLPTVVVFRTAPPAETRWWMERIVSELNEAWHAPEWHPLVLIADFVLWFLAIHPFLDGNGRLARALTQFLLLKAGYEYAPYSSLERVIEDRKVSYYLALQHSQVAARDDPGDYGEWLDFFLHALEAQQRALDTSLAAVQRLQPLPPAQQRIVSLITDRGPITTPHIAAALGIPARTVRYHLAQLTSAGLLVASKRTAGRRYSLPIEEVTPSPPAPLTDTSDVALSAAPDAARPTELMTPFDLSATFPMQMNSNPNGRAYATVVLGGLSSESQPLGDAELDAFERFASEAAPTATAMTATPEVAWWRMADEPRSDRLQLWMRPGPMVDVHWALDAEDMPDDGEAVLNPIGLVVCWQHFLRHGANLLQSLGVAECVVGVNLQTIPAGRPSIVGLDFAGLPIPTRSSSNLQAPPPWMAQRVRVSTDEIAGERVLRPAVDQLLRHFSYRHTGRTVDAIFDAASVLTWNVQSTPLRVTRRRGQVQLPTDAG